MNIVVPVKIVPDLVEELEINDEGTDLERDFLSYKINEFCDHALEEALQLKDAHGGTVTVLALERDETDKALFTALAKGADKAIKITGVDEDADSLMAATAMCKALADIDYDLVLTGVQAADDLHGQLGVLMANILGIPHASAVSDINIDGDTIRFHQEYAGGVTAGFESTPKLVLGVQSARQIPRYAPVSRVRQIMKETELAEVDVDVAGTGSTATVRRVFTKDAGEGAAMINGDAEDVAARIAEILNEARS